MAPCEYHGSTDLSLFEGWFEQQLCPSLQPGTVVILDNASFHKSDNIDHIAEEHGIEILYLPPYSPDLNPIEKLWANFKRNLRKCIKEFIKFQDAITHAFIADASSSGNILFVGTITNRTISTGDIFRINAGNLTITLS